MYKRNNTKSDLLSDFIAAPRPGLVAHSSNQITKVDTEAGGLWIEIQLGYSELLSKKIKIKKKAQKKEKEMGEKETVDGRDKNTR